MGAQNGSDWHEWGIAQFKEYVFEIDAETGEVLRHWSAGQDTPAHINSDVCVSDRELIYCNGASGTIVMIDLASFTSYRILDERPDLGTQLRAGRQAARTVADSLTRGSILTNGHQHLRALRVARGSLVDSVYACQISADNSLLFTANRGLNTITVYNYPENTVRLRVKMPELQEFDAGLRWWSDPRLGFHHSTLLSPVTDRCTRGVLILGQETTVDRLVDVLFRHSRLIIAAWVLLTALGAVFAVGLEGRAVPGGEASSSSQAESVARELSSNGQPSLFVVVTGEAAKPGAEGAARAAGAANEPGRHARCPRGGGAAAPAARTRRGSGHRAGTVHRWWRRRVDRRRPKDSGHRRAGAAGQPGVPRWVRRASRRAR